MAGLLRCLTAGKVTMKRYVLIMSCVLMIAALALGGTLAYFTDSDGADNEFTVGNVKITLTEPMWEESGREDAPEVYPGEALDKDPQITNTGLNPCFVRIQVTGLDCLGDAGLIRYRTDYVLDALGDKWTKQGDWFYYGGVLESDETTSALFDSIVIPTALENGDGKTAYSVNVSAQAVQAQGAKPSWEKVKTMTVPEIAAWFDTCMN